MAAAGGAGGGGAISPLPGVPPLPIPGAGGAAEFAAALEAGGAGASSPLLSREGSDRDYEREDKLLKQLKEEERALQFCKEFIRGAGWAAKPSPAEMAKTANEAEATQKRIEAIQEELEAIQEESSDSESTGGPMYAPL